MSSGTNISVTSPRTAVRVGTNLAATITNLIAAITAQQTMIVAANPSAGIVTLYNLTTIAKSCNNLTITAAPNRAGGAMKLPSDNEAGFWLTAVDPRDIIVTGLTAGDAVEYQVWTIPTPS